MQAKHKVAGRSTVTPDKDDLDMAVVAMQKLKDNLSNIENEETGKYTILFLYLLII